MFILSTLLSRPGQVVEPTLDAIQHALNVIIEAEVPRPPNLVPVFTTIPADVITPSLAYLKISDR